MKIKGIYKFLAFGLFISISYYSNGQIIDYYGFRIGIGKSNQFWSLKNYQSSWMDNKIGYDLYFNIEKKLNNFISIRPELGYIQKGFKNDFSYFHSAGNNPDMTYVYIKYRVNLHNLSTNISFKLIPFETKVKPFIIGGVRFDYLIKTHYDKIGIEKPVVDKFNKTVLSGLVGLGLDLFNLFYLELEYNPSITKNYNSDTGLSVKDEYYGISIGTYINNFIKKGE